MKPDAPAAPWRVLLADDHAMLREGLEMLVNSQADMAVVGHASSGPEAVAAARALQPHIAVIDVSMPAGGGTEATAEIVRSCPGVRVLALSRHADQATLRRMLAAGASGYVVKRAAAQALIGAMRAVLTGGIYVDPMLAGDLVARVIQPVGPDSASARRPCCGSSPGARATRKSPPPWGSASRPPKAIAPTAWRS